MQQTSSIFFSIEPELDVAEFIDVLRRSTLAERRPVENLEIMEAMLRRADIIVAARHAKLLVGVARSLSDFCYCTYLSDLAVDQQFQRRSIGRELIRRTHEMAGLHTNLILLAAPAAREYYPHIGMLRHDSCWTIPRSADHSKQS